MTPLFCLPSRRSESNNPNERILHLARNACWASFAVWKSIAGGFDRKSLGTSRARRARLSKGKGAGNWLSVDQASPTAGTAMTGSNELLSACCVAASLDEQFQRRTSDYLLRMRAGHSSE
jgi:hypothetical protein